MEWVSRRPGATRPSRRAPTSFRSTGIPVSNPAHQADAADPLPPSVALAPGGVPVQQNGHARRRSLGADQISLAVELLVLSERLMPGRSEEVRPMTRRELAATIVLRIPLTGVSMKMRSGAPSEAVDDGENHAVWAGVVPVVTGWGAPSASPLTADGTEVSASVRWR